MDYESEYDKKLRTSIKTLANNMSDEQIDEFYQNPGIAKFVRAFAEGKMVLNKINNSYYMVIARDSFSCPDVEKGSWLIVNDYEVS